MALQSVAVLATACLTASLSAQTMSERGFEPVDQLVDDVDPLSRSLRLREDGLQTIGQHGNVFRPKGPGEHDRYYYVSYGVTAEYHNRSLYGLYQFQDSDQPVILQQVPPGTVFHIGLPKQRPDERQQEQFVPPPGYIDARVAAHQSPPRGGVESMQHYATTKNRAQTWQRFNDQARAQRHLVLRTIKPVSEELAE